MVFRVHHFGEAVREIASDSDRTAAIVGLAVLDEPLTKILAWKGRSAVQLKKQSMMVRIEQARVRRYLREVEYHDFRIMTKVRNLFAHDPNVRSFVNSEVVTLCASLQLPEIRYSSLNLPVPQAPRDRFVRCVGLMLGRLEDIKTAQEMDGSKLYMWPVDRDGRETNRHEHILRFEELLAQRW